MSRIETIDGGNWVDLVQAPVAVLMLAKSDCEKCVAWATELASFLERDDEFSSVRFGKMLLDQRGLIDFKRASPWLAEVDVLPFNVIYVGGERVKSFAGGGVERLSNRLRRLTGDAG